MKQLANYIKLAEDAQEPVRQYEGDAGWDLFVSREVVIPPGEWADVHTDIAVALPPGMWAMITGRSSTFRKLGMQVQTGIIDNQYRGELFIAVWNPTSEHRRIQIGDRLAQFIPLPVAELVFAVGGSLTETQRGEAGFGSTGR